MRTGVFLQARLGSTRLPEKALLPLSGATVLQHVMRSLIGLDFDVFSVLTDQMSLPAFTPLAAQEGFEIFAGPADDVLARYSGAVRHYAVDRVVRATGDNPLVSALMVRAICRIHEEKHADLSHFLELPLGTGVEIIEAPALLEADRAASDAYEREHITPYLYRNRHHFHVVEEMCPLELSMPEAKVTIDTGDDYLWVSSIFKDLYRNRPIEIFELVEWLQENVPIGVAR